MDFIHRYEHVFSMLFGVFLLLAGFGVLGKKPRARNTTLIVAGAVILVIHALIFLFGG